MTAFRKALTASALSPKETIQVLYVLVRTLESLGQVPETLEAYRWISGRIRSMGMSPAESTTSVLDD